MGRLRSWGPPSLTCAREKGPACGCSREARSHSHRPGREAVGRSWGRLEGAGFQKWDAGPRETMLSCVHDLFMLARACVCQGTVIGRGGAVCVCVCVGRGEGVRWRETGIHSFMERPLCSRHWEKSSHQSRPTLLPPWLNILLRRTRAKQSYEKHTVCQVVMIAEEQSKAEKEDKD